ncbi:BTAD domain-containing putative transcriptional regulator [Actinoplanes sp. NPDC023936]|uniref:BTAD domain-containing putative transcriptional regulator n=1 Tax=Actinoplanes sp. NPDC023936 TaxID=3154910 RepID=UPI0033D6A245
MEFRILGPLEVLSRGAVVPLGGLNQRATLGALLLRANTVVATSYLIKALWDENPPLTARKMLQNAVSGLRTILNEHCTDGHTALLTHAPGYLIQTNADDVDLLRFHALVERGRIAAAAGSWEPAGGAFREALDLWRGPALADLVESGIGWPDLAVLENARLSAFEDYVEAQLAIGRHVSVLSELEHAVAVADLPRERMCRLLMLALYRSGRQADALGVYRRSRTALAEKLGLDPSRELQDLERAILSHDPALAVPPAVPQPAVDLGPRLPEPAPAPSVESPDPVPVAERKRVSALYARVWLTAADADADDQETADEQLEVLTAGFREEIERFGGVVQGLWAVGSSWVAVFGVPWNRENDVERAVRAAVAVRDRIVSSPADGCPIGVSLAVATGEALVTTRGEDAAGFEVTGGLVDQCRGLAERTPAGEIRVCEATRKATGRLFQYGDESVLLADVTDAEVEVIPFLERTREMATLTGLLDSVMQRRGSYLITVLGEPGIGKSRLVEELSRRAAERHGDLGWLVSRVPEFSDDPISAVLAQIVRSYAGISPGDPDPLVRRRLAELVPDRLVGRLLGLLQVADGGLPPADDLLDIWRRFIEAAAKARPLVLVIEDLHRADDRLLDLIERFVNRVAHVPILVLTTARLELLMRRPHWGGGNRNALMITLDPLSDKAAHQLLNTLATQHGLLPDPPSAPAGPAPADPQADPVQGGGCPSLFASIGGNPLFAIEYSRMHRDMAAQARRRGERWSGDTGITDQDVRSMPQSVRSIIAARLDTLPAAEKAVLMDAAVFTGPVWPSAIAALGERDVREAARCLEYLAQRDFLHRAGERAEDGEPLFAFRHTLMRDVAYEQMGRSARADRRQRVEQLLRPTQRPRDLPHQIRLGRRNPASGMAETTAQWS